MGEVEVWGAAQRRTVEAEHGHSNWQTTTTVAEGFEEKHCELVLIPATMVSMPLFPL